EAAGAHEGLAILDVDLLGRLPAVDGETRAPDGNLAQSPGRHAVEHLDRVGLEPTGGTEARLKAHAPCPVRQQQLVRQQARGRLAALEVRVALLNVALRDAVEGDEEARGAAVGLPVLGDARAQRLDVARVLVIVGDEMQLGERAPAGELRRHLVEHRAGGGAAVLREQRQHQDPLRARGAQPPERGAHVGRAVEHAELDRQRRQDSLRERAGELGAEALRELLERRTGRRPDAAVLLRDAPRPQRQNEPVQQWQPQRARQLHDTRVSEEAGEEGAHRRSFRRLRRAGVDQQDAVSFAISTASCSVSKRNNGATGPKVSSRATSMSRVTSTTTVGSKKVPPSAWRLPPCTIRAPLPTASARCCSTLASALVSMSGPCSVGPLSPSPTRSCATACTSFFVKASYTPACTRSRFAHTQVWPVLRYLLAMAPATAASRSASSNTMNGALPPCSSESFFTEPAHCAMSLLPSAAEPVKVSLRTSGLEVISPPIASALPVIMFSTPAGTPARAASEAAARAE